MRTVVLSGIISVAVLPRRRSFGFSFSLGEPPVDFYSPGGLGDYSIKPGDFVAIAAKRTLVPGAKYVALAYRPLGVEAHGRTIGAAWPAMCLGFGVIGTYFAYLGALQEPNGRYTFIPMILLGVFGIVRTLTMWQSVQLLNRMEMPLTTRLSGP